MYLTNKVLFYDPYLANGLVLFGFEGGGSVLELFSFNATQMQPCHLWASLFSFICFFFLRGEVEQLGIKDST